MKSSDVFPPGARFPIVGIGASAGGLVALEQFLSHVPLGSGLAFVIVQHLDPRRAGRLVELLQLHTQLPVVEARDQVPVEPDHVYVIPAGRDLCVRQGVLHLREPPEPRRLRLPIDFFFKSLAQDRQQQSIGVLLSGMGCDGRLIPEDIGRPIANVATDLRYPDLLQDAREVLRTLVSRERDVPASDGRWFRVRSMPYRTPENRIDGLVITFSDISVSKSLDAELRAAPAPLQTPVGCSRRMGVGCGLS